MSSLTSSKCTKPVEHLTLLGSLVLILSSYLFFCYSLIHQVDPEVLRELPADIRQQIERALKKKKTKNDEVASQSSSQTRKSARLTRGYSQQAGCSHWKTPPHHDPEEEVGVMEISEPEEVKVIGISEPEAVKVTEISETSGHNGDSIEALPAFSQVWLGVE